MRLPCFRCGHLQPRGNASRPPVKAWPLVPLHLLLRHKLRRHWAARSCSGTVSARPTHSPPGVPQVPTVATNSSPRGAPRPSVMFIPGGSVAKPQDVSFKSDCGWKKQNMCMPLAVHHVMLPDSEYMLTQPQSDRGCLCAIVVAPCYTIAYQPPTIYLQGRF